MLKVMLTLTILLLSVSAEELKVYSSGSYTVPLNTSIKDKKQFAREQALIVAKQNAIEKAGTVVYSSIQVEAHNGEEISHSTVEAISSALVRVNILQENFVNNIYTVEIEASVNVADVEEVFEKADARLKKIEQLHKKNGMITKELFELNKKFEKLLETKGYALKEVQTINKKQRELVRKYGSNINKMEVVFPKGTLAKMAINEKISRDNHLGAIQKMYDDSFTQDYFSEFVVQVLNIKPIQKNENKADIEFILYFGNKSSHKNIASNLKNIILSREYSKKKNARSRYHYDTIYFKNNRASQDLWEWIKKNRNIAICVTIGDRKYFTERIVYTYAGRNYKYRGSFMETMDTLMGVRKTVSLKYIDSTKGIMTKRKITDIPMQYLKDVRKITVNLVHVGEDDYYGRGGTDSDEYNYFSKRKEYPLKNLGEARNYYR